MHTNYQLSNHHKSKKWLLYFHMIGITESNHAHTKYPIPCTALKAS